MMMGSVIKVVSSRLKMPINFLSYRSLHALSLRAFVPALLTLFVLGRKRRIEITQVVFI